MDMSGQLNGRVEGIKSGLKRSHPTSKAKYFGHTMCNDMAERFNRTILGMLRTLQFHENPMKRSPREEKTRPAVQLSSVNKLLPVLPEG